MTKLVFTYAGTHNPDGRYATHLYIKQMEPDYDQMLGSERKAAADAQNTAAQAAEKAKAREEILRLRRERRRQRQKKRLKQRIQRAVKKLFLTAGPAAVAFPSF